jgi:hypothetical protein
MKEDVHNKKEEGINALKEHFVEIHLTMNLTFLLIIILMILIYNMAWQALIIFSRLL